MTAPTVHPITGHAYELLTSAERALDEQHDYAALALLAGMTRGLWEAADIARLGNPALAPNGVCELADPALAPRAWLPWLGWILGVDTRSLTDPETRAAIANAAAAHRRGSIGAIRGAVQRTLTGSRSCRVYPNASGTDPYLITVITLTSDTPTPVATLAAAWSQKPAGINLELQVADGATWTDLAAAYPSWAAVEAAFAAWDDVATWLP